MGGPEIQLTDPVWVTDHDGNSSNHPAGAGGMFDYLPVSQNLFSMLYSQWASAGDDLWQIRLELFTGGGVLLGSTAWNRDSGGDCKDFTVGIDVNGHFVARDIHFGYYDLVTLPASMSPNSPVPSSGNSQTVPFPGNLWSLNTAGMTPCGYVVVVKAWDRSIVNSHPNSHNYNQDDVGFCLRAASK